VDGSNVGWWVPVCIACVPLLLLLALHLLARLESWMFSSDERADRVARLLEEMDGPEEIEQEVTRLLAGVADAPAAAAARARTVPGGSPGGPGRTTAERSHRGRLRRVLAGPERPDRQSP
jgi:hypothetical protein